MTCDASEKRRGKSQGVGVGGGGGGGGRVMGDKLERVRARAGIGGRRLSPNGW